MRRRRQHAEESASHDRWLVSYADFVTLLFGFFVVLFASAYRDSQTLARLSTAIHNGFQTLGAFSGGTDTRPIAYFPVAAPPSDHAPRPHEVEPTSSQPLGSPTDLAQLRRQLEAAMGIELKNHEVELRITPEGFVISLHELGFFDSGKAALLPGAAAKIQRIAKILGQHGLDLRVEGHSDNQPIHNAQFRNNWELSTARAMTVLLLLVDHAGYNPAKISVAGYAQYRPIADDTTLGGRRRNRRVDLVVVGPANPPRQTP